MANFVTLLRCIGRAFKKKGLRAAMSFVPGGEGFHDICLQTFEELAKERAPVQSEVANAARATPAEAQQQAEQAAREVAPNDPAMQRELTIFLAQVPNHIRRSMRGPANPDGHNVPAGKRFDRVEDFADVIPPRLPRFREGQAWDNRRDWVLVKLLGMGGFGEVWKAENTHTGEVVSVKFCLDPATANDLPNALKMQQRARGLPGFVPLKDTNLNGKTPSLTYQYIDGYDLNSVIAEWQRLPNRERVERGTKCVAKLARIVGGAHRLRPDGLVHRDIKPANVLVERGTERDPVLWVIDLGIGGLTSKQALADQRTGTMTRALRGSHTPIYASPQQKTGNPPDPRDDVHALGVVWYQMMTGQSAEGPDMGAAKELRDLGMPGDWIELLERCVNKRAENRPADALVMAEAMERWFSALKAATPASEKPRTILQRVMVAVIARLVMGHNYIAAKNLSKFKVMVAVMALLVMGLFVAVVTSSRTPSSSRSDLTNSIGMQFNRIPGGTFAMGSLPNVGHDNERPQRNVTVDAFQMGIFEVTRSQYARYARFKPGHKNHYTLADGDAHKFPVDSVSYDDLVEFIDWINELPEEIAAGRKYRLPTEAEWEYASLGGAVSSNDATYGKPLGTNLTAQDANFNFSLGRTCHVGSYKPNGYGLYDMQGNTWEWCGDWFGPYDPKDTNNPKGPQTGTARVLRGGGCNSDADYCRCAYRYYGRPGDADYRVGARLVCVPRTVR